MSRPLRQRLRRDARALAGLLLLYLAVAYFLVPACWRRHAGPIDWSQAPKTTRTRDGIAGDPLNVALVGRRDEVVRALGSAGWVPADPRTLRTSLRITASVALGRPYPQAPVSDLYLWGRPQDLVFQRAAGKSPRRRHHARFWLADQADGQEGRPLWLGGATFDRSVGLSHRTGQVTHHIDGDVDAERDRLLQDLRAAGQLLRCYTVPGVGKTGRGRNGGGDRYWTDGLVSVGVLSGPPGPPGAP